MVKRKIDAMFARDKKMSTYDEEKFYDSEEGNLDPDFKHPNKKKFKFLKKNASRLSYNYDPTHKRWVVVSKSSKRTWPGSPMVRLKSDNNTTGQLNTVSKSTYYDQEDKSVIPEETDWDPTIIAKAKKDKRGVLITDLSVSESSTNSEASFFSLNGDPFGDKRRQ